MDGKTDPQGRAADSVAPVGGAASFPKEVEQAVERISKVGRHAAGCRDERSRDGA